MSGQGELGKLLDSVGKGFIVAFISLLVIASISLALGYEEHAEVLAEYGYYSLVAAVVAMLAATYLEEREPRLSASLARLGGWFRRFQHAVGGLRGAWILEYASLGLGLAGAFLVSAKGLDLFLEPGRPTVLATMVVTEYVSVVMVALLACSAVLAFLRGLVLAGVLAVVICVLGVLLQSPVLLFAPIVYTLYLLRRFDPGKVLDTSVIVILAASAVVVVQVGLVVKLGWGVLSSAAIVGLVIGLGGFLLVLSTSRSFDVQGYGSAGRGGWNVWLGAGLVSLVFSTASVMIPHIIHGWYIVSLDTVFHEDNCARIVVEGDYFHALVWSRPLYSLTICPIPYVAGISPRVFFDIIVPIVGLFVLGLAAGYILYWMGLRGPYLLAGVVVALAYWSPFFVYAGLQTNLLILPLAIILYKLVADILLRDRLDYRIIAAISMGSIVLGLWHPWTLVYYGLPAILVTLFLRVREKDLYRILAGILYLVPGLLAHMLVGLLAGSSGLVSAIASVVRYEPFLWSLKVFMWGTGLRGEIIFPAALVLAYMGLRGISKSRAAYTLWLVASLAPVFLGVLMPMSKLFIRLLVNSLIPIFLYYTIHDLTGGRKTTIIPLVLSSILVWLYLVLRATPIPGGHPLVPLPG